MFTGIRLAAVVALTFVAAASAQAAAMRCSGEEQICIATCNKTATKANLSACITTCGQRNAACKKTGCWDSGAQQYCGVQRN